MLRLLFVSLIALCSVVGCASSDSEGGSVLDAYVRVADAGGIGIQDMLVTGNEGLPPAGRDASLPGGGADASRPGDSPGGFDCDDLSDCLARCTDGLCSQDCRMRASDEASQTYDAIYACATANTCNEPGGRYNRECMDANCSQEQEDCYGPPPPPPPPPMGQGTCDELLDCLQQCPDDGTYVCRDNCVRAASPQSYNDYIGYQTCLLDADCGRADEACRVAACEAEIITCLGEVAVPMGTNSCTEYDSCIRACPDGDQGCLSACITMASPDAYNLYRTILLCIGSSGCPEGDAECQRMVCGREIDACFMPPEPMGTMNCGALARCVSECPDGDRACYDGCFSQASQEAYDLYDAAQECIGMSGCMGGDANCQRQFCGDEIDACVLPEMNGNGTCSQLMDCLQTCANSADRAACQDNCIARTSPFAWTLYEAIYTCVETSGCAPNDSACVQRVCANQINTCFNN